MTTEPKRLVMDDPGFAHLVAASNKEGPSSAQVDKALSLASRAAVPTRWSSWLGARLLVGLGVMGLSMLVVIAAHRTPPPLPPPPVAIAPVAVPREPAAPAPIGAPVLTISVDDLATSPPVASAELSARTTRAKISENIDAKRTTFAEEVALVAAARSALGTSDVSSCMRAVDEYRERFGAGTFAPEVEVIRIEALVMSGEHDRAVAAADHFLQANAGSP